MHLQVLITGARTSTLLTRLPFLPAADAYVAENGGRIFYPDTTLPTAMPLAEDSKWRKTHNATGARACWCWQAATGLASNDLRALLEQRKCLPYPDAESKGSGVLLMNRDERSF